MASTILAQLLIPGLDNIFPSICCFALGLIAGLLAILASLFREFVLATRLAIFCVLISAVPTAVMQFKATRSIVFETYLSLSLPSLLGFVAFGICLLYSDFRESVRCSIFSMLAWATLASFILAILVFLVV